MTSIWDATLHDTASRILDAASDLFAAQGFRATTVKEITEQCGMTQAALYLYFPSKDAVLVELINVGHQQLTRYLDNADPPERRAGDPGRRLVALVGGMVTYATECTIVARVADRDWQALTGLGRASVAELRRDVRQRFEAVVQACLDGGLFPTASATVSEIGDHRARLLATAIIDMCSGVYHWYNPTISVPPTALVASYQETVMAMAGGKPTRRGRANGEVPGQVADPGPGSPRPRSDPGR